MKFSTPFLIMAILLFSLNKLQSQTNNLAVKNAISIAKNNKSQLENVEQLLVVYNEKPESFTAVFVALEKKGNKWVVKQNPIEAGIGKNGFAFPNKKKKATANRQQEFSGWEDYFLTKNKPTHYWKISKPPKKTNGLMM